MARGEALRALSAAACDEPLVSLAAAESLSLLGRSDSALVAVRSGGLAAWVGGARAANHRNGSDCHDSRENEHQQRSAGPLRGKPLVTVQSFAAFA